MLKHRDEAAVDTLLSDLRQRMLALNVQLAEAQRTMRDLNDKLLTARLAHPLAVSGSPLELATQAARAHMDELAAQMTDVQNEINKLEGRV